ncbi:hypothetical protein [Microvirga sp. M2]|uniref:hypothetical protein n=1 Tax=Microvirga sp. M2 TaxID=3073270 RepID=UPI0039C34FEA
MGVSGLGLLCLGRDDPNLQQQGQVIGRDPRQRRAQDLDVNRTEELTPWAN